MDQRSGLAMHVPVAGVWIALAVGLAEMMVGMAAVAEEGKKWAVGSAVP